MDRLTILSKRINENLDNLEIYVENYKTLTMKLCTSVLDKNKENVVIANIEDLSIKVKQISTTIKNQIVSLTKFLNESLSDKEKEVSSWHINAHSTRLINLTNRFREYNFNFKQNEENRLKFLFRTANLEATEKQIDECIHSPGANTKVHAYFALDDKSKQIKLDEALRRQNEIRRINELSDEIKEITEMVSDLIYQQSTNVDNLADGLFEIQELSKNSNTELQTTLDYKIRRGKFWRTVFYLFVFVSGSYITYKTLSNRSPDSSN